MKTDETDVINFLLTTEIIPLSLRIMQSGSELSKTVATFILQKILADDSGLSYICQTFDRFSHVAMVLGRMVLQQQREASGRLLKHIIRCYLRLSDNARAREALRSCLPDCLKDNTFVSRSILSKVFFLSHSNSFRRQFLKKINRLKNGYHSY